MLYLIPSDLPTGKKIEALVQLIDIAPTVLEFFGVDIPDEFKGILKI